jgi:uncharacterized DUF497 family protein
VDFEWDPEKARSNRRLHGVSFPEGLKRRIDTIEETRTETLAWRDHRNHANACIDWQFTTAGARTKLKRLYPTLDE